MARVKQFKLPDVGEGLTEAEIVTWKVKAGDTVKVNEIVVEIETAKSLVELPVAVRRAVTELLVPEGETVDVGTPIIAVDTGVDDGLPEAPAPRRCHRRRRRTRRVEAGLIGGAAPGGRVAVLVGYGPRTTAAKRRPRKGAVPARPAVPAGTGGRAAAPMHAAVAAGTRDAAAVTRRRAGRRTGRWRPARWPSRRCASWPRTSASTCADVAGDRRGRHHHPRRRRPARRDRRGRDRSGRRGAGAGAGPGCARASARPGSRSRACAR